VARVNEQNIRFGLRFKNLDTYLLHTFVIMRVSQGPFILRTAGRGYRSHAGHCRRDSGFFVIPGQGIHHKKCLQDQS
jgi:hypothetical protein